MSEEEKLPSLKSPSGQLFLWTMIEAGKPFLKDNNELMQKAKSVQEEIEERVREHIYKKLNELWQRFHGDVKNELKRREEEKK